MSPGQSSPQTDSLQKAGFWAAVFLLFIVHSRVFEFALSSLHIPAIALGLAIVFAILAGGLQRTLASAAGVCLVALTLWMIAGVPFAIWRGGAARVLTDQWLRAIPILIVIVGLVVTYGQLRGVFYVMAWSIAILAVLAVLFGTSESGRLILPGQGKFANPNDLAAIMLIGLPFWWYLFASPRAGKGGKAVALVSMALMLAVLLKTGSRGAMIGVVAIVVVLVIASPGIRRIQIAAAALMLAVVALLVLPSSLTERYFTYFNSEVDESDTQANYELQASAVGSAVARTEILKQSLLVTLEHPLFGVGAGQFAVAQDVMAKEQGAMRGAWAVTHNSYTQVSSETGIPGALFYLGAMILSFRALLKCRTRRGAEASPEAADLGRMASCLTVALLAYAVCSFFMSVAYQMFFPLLVGLAVSAASINRQLQAAAAAAPQAAPAVPKRFAAAAGRAR